MSYRHASFFSEGEKVTKLHCTQKVDDITASNFVQISQLIKRTVFIQINAPSLINIPHTFYGEKGTRMPPNCALSY